LAEERKILATKRTLLSTYRSVLAKGRTELAFIRTGLAFIALGIGLMRYFGLGMWTIVDGSLVVLGAASSIFGIRNYMVTRNYERIFQDKLSRLISDAQSVNIN
jgi:uncharacterized membrane protein YidH (DUF202 family)